MCRAHRRRPPWGSGRPGAGSLRLVRSENQGDVVVDVLVAIVGAVPAPALEGSAPTEGSTGVVKVQVRHAVGVLAARWDSHRYREGGVDVVEYLDSQPGRRCAQGNAGQGAAAGEDAFADRGSRREADAGQGGAAGGGGFADTRYPRAAYGLKRGKLLEGGVVISPPRDNTRCLIGQGKIDDFDIAETV